MQVPNIVKLENITLSGILGYAESVGYFLGQVSKEDWQEGKPVFFVRNSCEQYNNKFVRFTFEVLEGSNNAIDTGTTLRLEGKVAISFQKFQLIIEHSRYGLDSLIPEEFLGCKIRFLVREFDPEKEEEIEKLPTERESLAELTNRIFQGSDTLGELLAAQERTNGLLEELVQLLKREG